MKQTVHMMGGLAQKEYFNPGPEDEVWGLNMIKFKWLDGEDPRWTRFFNLHKYENLRRYGYNIEREVEWVKAHPMVHLTSDLWPELAGVVGYHKAFPREFVEAFFGDRGAYHCGSLDWMVAYAITMLEAGDEIVLHGVSLLAGGGEPISARACLEYWCGVAEGRDIKVTSTPDCDIFAFYHLVKSNMVYGYDDTPVFEDRTRDLKGEPPYKIPERAA